MNLLHDFSMLLVKIMLYLELHCQRSLKLKHTSYEIISSLQAGGVRHHGGACVRPLRSLHDF